MMLLEFLLMRVRFTNQFLVVAGSGFALLNMFFPSIFGNFMFGACFGGILLNFIEAKKK